MGLASPWTVSNRRSAIQPTPSHVRPLALAGYPVALLLIATSLMDTLPKILPANFGSADWRYGALGLTFNSLVTPLLGLVLAAAAALIARQYRALRVVSVAFLVVAAFALVGGLLFLVDYNGVSSGLSERAASAFRVATWKTALIALLVVPAALWFGIGGLRAASARPADGEGTSGSLVVGQ